ncbi:MAG: hypothetical protein GY789_28270 [Hyphomicrobiales bacterium]|nr:hypothetical protein [Hyphomicrobiales bacterium]MCP5076019.1 hypothetical protein [Paracoccaceae bacterium]
MEYKNLPLISHAALGVLVILQTTMLGALFTQTVPHPPLTIPLFALGPFLGASISIAAAAWILGACSTGAGRAMTVVAALLALISFGPQKWIDPAIGQIWPAVLLAELAIVVIAVSVYKRW